MDRNRYALGRSLQLVGLAVPPLAIAAQLADKVGLGVSMLIAAGGVLIFLVGLSIQNRSL